MALTYPEKCFLFLLIALKLFKCIAKSLEIEKLNALMKYPCDLQILIYSPLPFFSGFVLSITTFFPSFKFSSRHLTTFSLVFNVS